MRTVILSLVAIGLLAAIAGFVIAEDDAISVSKRSDFDAILAHINCKIQLTEKQLDLLTPVNASLASYKKPLDDEYAKMQEFADAKDHKGLLEYITTTFKNDLKISVDAVKSGKSGFGSANLTAEEKKSIRDQHKEAIELYANCTKEADKAWADARVGYMNAWIEKWNNVISKMKEEGYETLKMEKVVSDAQTKLVPALDAINKSTTSAARKTAMENARTLHLHLWASFEIARINEYLLGIENNAVTAGYQEDVDAIKTKLTEAETLAVEGKKYGPGEFETTWKAIKDAAATLKDLNKKLKEIK